MGLSDESREPSPLQKAVARGLAPGGDLAAELGKLRGAQVRSPGDGEAVCRALEAVCEGRAACESGESELLHALTGLFQAVADPDGEAAAVLRSEGVALLARIVEAAWAQKNRDGNDLLFILKILALYRTPQGADLVVRAARSGFAPHGYLWSVVLGAFKPGHPHAHRVFAALGEELPTDPIGVAVLEAANRYLLDGGDLRHPFDTDAGTRKLQEWLADSDPDRSDYAVSAAVAIAFLRHPDRRRLLRMAADHPSGTVRLESAWAAARLGQPTGLDCLARLCLDVNTSSRAIAYLEELGRAELAPVAARSPEFAARAEFAQWLAHPNELGRAPDNVEIVDHRSLPWPPDREPRPLWLVRYRIKDTTGLAGDDVGVGLVGSTTFCLFSYHADQRHPEDAYAMHCCWELEQKNLLTAADLDPGSSEYDGLLRQWNGGPLESPNVVALYEAAPGAAYPRRLVGLASARRAGRGGWVVLDGPESRWYAAEEMPTGAPDKTVLMVHVGRRLLGFTQEPVRDRYLRRRPVPDPPHVIRAYEELLGRAASGPPSERKRLMSTGGALDAHFDAYAKARSAALGGAQAAHVAEAYERILGIARLADGTSAAGTFDSSGALGNHFEAAVDAWIELGRAASVRAAIDLFAPHWQHNSGYGTLGAAAFRAGLDELAEAFLLRLKAGYKDWRRSKEMSLLAELWHRRGRSEEARALLFDCLVGLLGESRRAKGSDRRLFEEWFQTHRRTFLRLFPEAADELARRGIPACTFPPGDRS